MIGLITLNEFAKMLNKPITTVRTWKQRGELPSFLFKKVGGCVYVKESKIQEWIDSDS